MAEVLSTILNGILEIPNFLINCFNYIRSLISLLPNPFLGILLPYVSVILVIYALRVVKME